MLVLTNVTVAFKEGQDTRTVLDHLDFTAREGEMSFIVGESGSGKSTLLSVAVGLDGLGDRKMGAQAGRPAPARRHRACAHGLPGARACRRTHDRSLIEPGDEVFELGVREPAFA